MSKRVEWTLPVQLTEEEKAEISAEFEVVTVREMDEHDEAAYAAEMQTALSFN